jgi:hypothetical protein
MADNQTAQPTFVPSGYTIASQTDTMSLPVYMNTWVRLREKVRGCRRGVGFWGSFFPTVLGVFLSTIVPTYLDIADEISKRMFSITPWMVAFLLSLVAGLLSRRAYLDALRHEDESIKSIVDEMEELQARFTRAV